MKVRQDAWTEENDLLLAETVLRHVREGSTQLNAFEEVGDKLNRTSAACGFRWNAVVRHRYEKALQLAKKQRKQRQRILGKDQGGKKKLLYNPPVPKVEDLQDIPLTADLSVDTTVNKPDMTVELATETFTQPTSQVPTEMTIDTVIAFLENFKHSNLQNIALKSENERLKKEIADLRKQNEEMSMKIKELEENKETMQEDYETLMKIMNRARKLVLFEEEERPATKFKMDRNGNLEKLAE
ncbi:RsfA family transcriptional regulator [Neobacillus sedimentimangrovi]|uniref:RsfA family transcriptional regulator n=1 Tax=Neobacillus sedimentimangrovi TaxID=2699460 RepID=A0ABS8QG41_9BACI|nr:RsfA family transcriptional regulator [Neobacillus sedimentimangrovi]MCD4838098.1 RsfA family transcriptional regulator [Neobacillus sedimentimangrovi]